MSERKSRKLPTLIILALIAVLAIGTVIYKVFNLGSPTTQKVNTSEYYEAEAGKAAVIVNGKLTNVRAVLKNQQIYLRLGLVTEQINSHFYYETKERILFYTSAEEIVEADATSLHNSARIFFDIDEDNESSTLGASDRIYVLLSYVANYTNIDYEYYTNPSRVFIRSIFGECEEGTAAGGAQLRTGANNSSPVLEELERGTGLWIISRENGWSKVYAGEGCGHAGYLKDEEISDVETKTVPDKYVAPSYNYNLLGEKVCMVWHQVFTESGVKKLDKLLKITSGANVISPTWFSVTGSDGTIESRANKEYVSKAKAKGLKVWALVENFNTDNTLDYSALLGSRSSRRKMTDTLVSKALEYGIDGINVDFEGLPSGSGEAYRQFIRELSISCHKNGLVLSVDCYVPSAWTGHYYRKDISEAADYFIVMAYDEHYEGSDAGSTASIGFVEDALKNTIEEGVDPKRFIAAIPFYSRLWSGEGGSLESSTISMDDMREFMGKYKDYARWDENSEQYYVSVTVDGVLKRLWAEDGKSLAAKLEVVREYNVAGIACWKLGMENVDAWGKIKDYLNR